MKNNNFVNATVAIAGGLFLMGAITQKSQIKDVGLGTFVAMGLIKQHSTDKKLHNHAKNYSATWQASILSEVTKLSNSLEIVEEKIAKPVDFSFPTQKLDRAIKLISKLEKRLENQEKQQNKMRSLFDKFKHKMKMKEKRSEQGQLVRKKINSSNKSNKITAQLIAQQPTTHVYIDGNNLKCTAQRLNITINYKAFKSYLMPHHGKIKLNFYDGVCRTSRFKQNSFHTYLRQLGYNVVTLPKKNHQDGTQKTVGDDVLIAIDILDKVSTGDRLILISGDGDFFPVIEKIQQRQIKVTAIASVVSVSELISNKVDEFISLEELPELIAKNDNAAVA